MKNAVVTVIVGFITGLVISGILFDVIKYVGKSFNRVQVAWTISKAEKVYTKERFSDSINLYNKVIPKIDSSNKLLLAKTKNNLALCIMKKIEKENNFYFLDNTKKIKIENSQEIETVLLLLNQSKDLYREINNKELLEQSLKNIQLVEKYIKK